MFRNIFEIVFGEITSEPLSFLAGYILTFLSELSNKIPGIWILVPTFLAISGNAGSIIVAKTSTKAHIQKINFYNTLKDIKFTLLASFFAYLMAGLLSFLISNSLNVIFVSVIAGLLVSFIILPFSSFLTLFLYKRGFDPDNIAASWISTFADIIGAIILLGVCILI